MFVRFDERRVLDDVSFELAAGRLLALLGPNGAGKTSLIRILNGTISGDVGGEVTIDGKVLIAMSRREIASQIAVVAQENETRFPVTVLEFVLAGRFVQGGVFGWETDEDKSAAMSALVECDLAGYEFRLMNQLSGGERQRAVLARAIATNAPILLLDEPTANLDLAHQVLMFRLVRDRCAVGSSAVVITHDLNLAAAFADEILMLKDGRVAAQGPPADVLTVENIRLVFGVDVIVDESPVGGTVRVTGIFSEAGQNHLR